MDIKIASLPPEVRKDIGSGYTVVPDSQNNGFLRFIKIKNGHYHFRQGYTGFGYNVIGFGVDILQKFSDEAIVITPLKIGERVQSGVTGMQAFVDGTYMQDEMISINADFDTLEEYDVSFATKEARDQDLATRLVRHQIGCVLPNEVRDDVVDGFFIYKDREHAGYQRAKNVGARKFDVRLGYEKYCVKQGNVKRVLNCITHVVDLNILSDEEISDAIDMEFDEVAQLQERCANDVEFDYELARLVFSSSNMGAI